MIKKYFFILLIITFSASGMFPIDDSLSFFEGFPFDIEPNVGESVGSRSASLTYEVDNNLYGLFGGEREMAFNGESDDQVYYENIDDFCQAIELPACRSLMASWFYLIMTKPAEQWLGQEREIVKLGVLLESLIQRRALKLNISCLNLLVAIVNNDKDEVTERLKELPSCYAGKVIIHATVLMYYLSIDISVSELLIKLHELKIAINNNFFFSKFVNYLVQNTKCLIITLQEQGPERAEALLRNYMENCKKYLMYVPILEQYQLRMKKILAR